MSRWNWWAPKPPVWLHEQFGIGEGPKKQGTLVEPIEVSVQHNGREVAASMTNVGLASRFAAPSERVVHRVSHTPPKAKIAPITGPVANSRNQYPK
jgi:hypothetical protein